jgi:hypothetical protein
MEQRHGGGKQLENIIDIVKELSLSWNLTK